MAPSRKNQPVETSANPDALLEGLGAGQEPLSVLNNPYVPQDTEEQDILDESLERQVTSLGRATAEKLRQFPKEKVMIPIDKLNKEDKYVVVGINGWNFQIERNQPVVLPQPIIDLLEQGGYQPTRVR